jgi:MoxR-like ATPase
MIFDKIGVYGLNNNIEDAFLASFLTGDPALLIGKQGTSKTGLCAAIGYAMREYSKKEKAKNSDHKLFSFRIYDSSKINFEDLVGFPNPKAMQEGRMEFIRSKTTAWDSDMIIFDEYNRQEPARQNNIFELQRSRRLMGINTGTKWIFNCMNPFGMAGTEELDEALVDRNSFFIYIPSFVELPEEAQSLIVRHSSDSDGPGLRHWTNKDFLWDIADESTSINEKFANAGELITKLMKVAGEYYTQIEKSAGAAYSNFVRRFVCVLSSEMQNKQWKVELSGRRAGVMYRALIAFRAIDLAKADLDSNHEVRDLKDCFKAVLRMTTPVGISESTSSMNDFADASISSTVDMFSDFFDCSADSKSAKTSIDIIYEVLTTKNLLRKIDLLVNSIKDEVAKNQIWTQLISKTSKGESSKNFITAGIISHLMTIRPECIPQSLHHLIVSNYNTSLATLANSFNVTLYGSMCNYKTQVEKAISKQKNSFTKIQAKIIFESESQRLIGQDEITEFQFSDILEKIERECRYLDSALKEKGLLNSEVLST